MKRRRFSIITSIAVTGFFVPVLSCNSDIINVLSNPNSLLSIMNNDELEIIGIEYLNKFPQEAKQEVLVKLIYDNYPDDISNFELEYLIQEKITLDFEKNNIVVLNGWILSKAEARQCALYYKS